MIVEIVVALSGARATRATIIVGARPWFTESVRIGTRSDCGYSQRRRGRRRLNNLQGQLH